MIHTFASDNYSSVHPKVMEALVLANKGHQGAYGNDELTPRLVARFRELFGLDLSCFLVFNGTGANVVALASCLASYETILCAGTAHIHVDECGAPQKFTQSKIIAIPTEDGKLTPQLLRPYIIRKGDPHFSQPRVVSITQSTEYGTVYTAQEVKELCDFAHQNQLYVHMDGARIANATTFLGGDVRSFTVAAGVDVLSFGGTKNGMMYGEAVIFFNVELGKQTQYIRKQSMQLASKMRFVAAQFLAVLENDLWLDTAAHANQMAQLLAKELQPYFLITKAVQANEVFAVMPDDLVTKLQASSFFYVWDEAISEVRFVCSFDTQEAHIHEFVKTIKQLL